MKQSQMLDAYEVRGSDERDFIQLLDDICASTKITKIGGSDLIWLSKASHPDLSDSLVETSIDPFAEVSSFHTRDEIRLDGYSEELKQEFWDGRMILARRDESGKYIFLMCKGSITSEMTFSGVTGGCTVTPSYALVALLHQRCENLPLTLISRFSEDGVTKIFSIRSGMYMYVPQTEIIGMTKQFADEKDGKLLNWYFSHSKTYANYVFEKEAADVVLRNGQSINAVPIVRVSTSDSGEACICWNLMWQVQGSLCCLSHGSHEVSRKHKGEWNETEKGKVNQKLEQLFLKLEDFRQKIDELDKIELYGDDPIVVLENLMEDNPGFKNYVKREIRSAIINEAGMYFTSIAHTAAEVVLYAMNIPDKLVNLSEHGREEVRKAVGEFPYQKIRGAAGLKS